MKILIINPNTSEEMTKGIDITAKKYARQDTEIVSVTNKKGPASIESNYETALASEGVLVLKTSRLLPSGLWTWLSTLCSKGFISSN